MNLALDGLKLALAGLMVVAELFGTTNPNGLVLDNARKLGVSDPYTIQSEKLAPVYLDTEGVDLPSLLPYRQDLFSRPIIGAEAAVILDEVSGAILFELNADEKRAMASTTKLMTAIVTRENLDLAEIVTVDAEDTMVEPMKMWLIPGEQISVDALLKAALIPSYNDAALVLARAAGDGSIDAFTQKMNEKALNMGLTNTHFANPHGLDAIDHFTTAKELAMISRYAMQDKYIRETVATEEITVYSENGSSYPLKNTNELLKSYLDIRGAKTGFTDEAGQVLVTRALNEEGNGIIVVVMNSSDRFQESKILVDWAFRAYYWD